MSDTEDRALIRTVSDEAAGPPEDPGVVPTGQMPDPTADAEGSLTEVTAMPAAPDSTRTSADEPDPIRMEGEGLVQTEVDEPLTDPVSAGGVPMETVAERPVDSSSPEQSPALTGPVAGLDSPAAPLDGMPPEPGPLLDEAGRDDAFATGQGGLEAASTQYGGALARLVAGQVRAVSPIEQLMMSLVLEDPGPGLFLHPDALGLSLRVDKAGSGQDAPPVFIPDAAGHALIAVMDGMGGSGGAPVSLPGIDDLRPNAYFASRLAARTLRALAIGDAWPGGDWLAGAAPAPGPEIASVDPVGDWSATPGVLADQLASWLHRGLKTYFRACLDQGLMRPQRLRGRMIRDLPTTFTMALISDRGDGRILVDTFNCGDSRVYVLEPALRGGLAWLTLDDIGRPLDAMQCLQQDPPITAMISGSAEAVVTHRRFELSGPCLLLACSDGFHHYHQSPLDLEVGLLEAMRAATQGGSQESRLQRFGAALLEAVSANIQDDVTVALRFVGAPPASLMEQLLAEDAEAGRSEAIRRATRDGEADDYWLTARAQFERYLGVSDPEEDSR